MFLPDDLIDIILSFVHNFELLQWIKKESLDWHGLSSNPAAIHLLDKSKDKIDWDRLSSNPAAIHLLEQNQDKINWQCLSSNPNILNRVSKQALTAILQNIVLNR